MRVVIAMLLLIALVTPASACDYGVQQFSAYQFAQPVQAFSVYQPVQQFRVQQFAQPVYAQRFQQVQRVQVQRVRVQRFVQPQRVIIQQRGLFGRRTRVIVR